jgi:parallel beta-helix repeat protein
MHFFLSAPLRVWVSIAIVSLALGCSSDARVNPEGDSSIGEPRMDASRRDHAGGPRTDEARAFDVGRRIDSGGVRDGSFENAGSVMPGPSPFPCFDGTFVLDGPVVNVKNNGAAGDGITNDNSAIQTAIDSAPDGSTIYFPVGTYLIDDIKILNRNRLKLEGESESSVVKRHLNSPRMFTIEHTTDLLIQNLRFDQNAVADYSGVSMASVRRLRIEKTHFVNSNAPPPGETDRFAYLLNTGNVPSEDVTITDNVIEDLQLSISHARRVCITANTVARAVRTAGIGIFSNANNESPTVPGTIVEDVFMSGNTVIDPVPGTRGAFVAVLDPPSDLNCTMRRLTFTKNRIRRSTTWGSAFFIGTSSVITGTVGNIFEDITIEDNKVRVAPGAPTQGGDEDAFVSVLSSAIANFYVDRIIVRHNTYTSNETGLGVGVRRIRDALITGNWLMNVGSGINLVDGIRNTDISGNTIDAPGGVGIYFGYSDGDNRLRNNTFVNWPSDPCQFEAVLESDILECPPQQATDTFGAIGSGVRR